MSKLIIYLVRYEFYMRKIVFYSNSLSNKCIKTQIKFTQNIRFFGELTD